MASQAQIPPFNIGAPSGWSIQDGAIDILLVFDETEENITATCRAYFGDGSPSVSGNWSRDLSFSHKFPSSGTFNTTVTCSNTVSERSNFHITEVVFGDVPMSGMTAVIPGYILVGTPFEIKLSVTEGTNVLYRVIPGENDPVWVLTSGTDTSETLTYTLNKAGKVTVSVTATNEVSFAQSRPKAEVINPVTGFRLTATNSIVSVTDQVNFTLHIPESKFFSMGPLRIELFDNMTSITPKVSLTVKPSTTMTVLTTNLSLGIHHIEARISSPLDEQDVGVIVLAIEPITQFNASDVKFEIDSFFSMNSTDVTSNASLTVVIPDVDASGVPPVGIEITWDFGDDSPTETEFITSWVKEHSYYSRGNYTITASTRLTGSQDVHTSSLPIRIGVLAITASQLQGEAGKDAFTFSISGAQGREVGYQIALGNGQQISFNKTHVFEGNITEVSVTYREPGVYRPRIFAWSEYFAESIYLDDAILVYRAVEKYNLSWTKSTDGKLPALIEFSLTFLGNLPTNTTCALDFGDGKNRTVEILPPVDEMTTETMDQSTPTVDTTSITEQTTSDATVERTTLAGTKGDLGESFNSTSDLYTTEQTTARDSTVESSSVTLPPKSTTFAIQHNYTSFSTFTLQVSCSNAVSNATYGWTLQVKASSSMTIPASVVICVQTFLSLLLT